MKRATLTPVVAGAALIVAVLLAGCTATPAPQTSGSGTGSSPSVSPSTSPTATAPSAAASFSSIEALRSAVQAAGIDCSAWVLKTGVAGATASGTCGTDDDGWGLALFPSAAERNHVLQLNQESVEAEAFVVGPNWLVNHYYGTGADLEPVRSALGGGIWTKGDALPPA